MDTYYLFPVWIRNDLAFATPALNKVKGRAIYRGRGRKFTVQGLTFNIGLFHAFGPSILSQATLAELHSRSITTGCCPGASSFRNKLPKQGTWSGANIPLKLCKTEEKGQAAPADSWSLPSAVGGVHLRAFLVVPAVLPSCCLRLAPLPFPLLPAAIPPLKRRQVAFSELWQTPRGPLPGDKHSQRAFVRHRRISCPEAYWTSPWFAEPAGWLPAQNTAFWQRLQRAQRQGHLGYRCALRLLNELQLLEHVSRVWHKCTFTHPDCRHPQLEVTVWIVFFPLKSIQTSIRRTSPLKGCLLAWTTHGIVHKHERGTGSAEALNLNFQQHKVHQTWKQKTEILKRCFSSVLLGIWCGCTWHRRKGGFFSRQSLQWLKLCQCIKFRLDESGLWN